MRTLMMAVGGAVLMALSAVSAAHARTKFVCHPIPGAADAQAALNAFWHRSIRLCDSPGRGSAMAIPEERTIVADGAWLAHVWRRYGPAAPTGVLAHEWAHMGQGDFWGAESELQADCLAGAFLKAWGLAPADLLPFERLSRDSGDSRWRTSGHGMGYERRNAVLRGYTGYEMFRRPLLRNCATWHRRPGRRPAHARASEITFRRAAASVAKAPVHRP